MIHTALKFVGRSIAQLIGLFGSTCEQSLDDRPQIDGSEFVGDHNFRTDRMDCGTDAYGWYEDDL